MMYELCIGYKDEENSLFNDFNDARNNLYTCLKVIIKILDMQCVNHNTSTLEVCNDNLYTSIWMNWFKCSVWHTLLMIYSLYPSFYPSNLWQNANLVTIMTFAPKQYQHIIFDQVLPELFEVKDKSNHSQNFH